MKRIKWCIAFGCMIATLLCSCVLQDHGGSTTPGKSETSEENAIEMTEEEDDLCRDEKTDTSKKSEEHEKENSESTAVTVLEEKYDFKDDGDVNKNNETVANGVETKQPEINADPAPEVTVGANELPPIPGRE